VLTRMNTPIASGIVAFALAFALGGAAVGVALVADTVTPDDENTPAVVDTIATFEDIDGNGVDDDCQTPPAVAAPEAEASAAAAVDLDQDGTISKSEAAKSDRIGGKNCNHGGYVSGVAKADDEDATEDEYDDENAPESDGTTATFEDLDGNNVDDDCQEAVEVNAEAEAAAVAAVDLNQDGTISKSEAAKSDRIGGKNCNHGGYVSGVAKGDKPDKAEKAAAKAARAEAKAARKAAKDH
jgi:hypothetical protein